MQMIEVKNSFHSYTQNDVYALNDVSFEIGKGEIFGFENNHPGSPLRISGTAPGGSHHRKEEI